MAYSGFRSRQHVCDATPASDVCPGQIDAKANVSGAAGLAVEATLPEASRPRQANSQLAVIGAGSVAETLLHAFIQLGGRLLAPCRHRIARRRGVRLGCAVRLGSLSRLDQWRKGAGHLAQRPATGAPGSSRQKCSVSISGPSPERLIISD